jgi:hypothetical protein
MKLVFKQDGKLMISRQGTVSEGHYEPLLVANSIVITINGASRLYNHIYTDEGLIFLQLDDGGSKPLVMINNNLLNGRSPGEYLNDTYVAPQKADVSHQRAKELRNELGLTYWTSIWQGSKLLTIYLSQTSNRNYAYCKSTILNKGKYILENNPTSILIIKELGEVEEFYTIQRYKQKDGSELVVHSNPKDGIVNGCKAFVNDSPALDGRYRLTWLKSVNVKNGVVTD